MGVGSMNRLRVKLAITAAAGSLLLSNPILAQILPPQKRAEHVEITKAPELESAVSYMAIVRWTTTNPRGDDEHYGVVHYGTDPADLSQTANGHIRLNRAHPETLFRVRMVDLKPQTTYYYKLSSTESTGASGGGGETGHVSGNGHLQLVLAQELGDLRGREAALVCTSGYGAKAAALSTLARELPGMVVFSDAFTQASLIAGSRNSRAEKHIFC